MNKRERVIRALNHNSPDITPWSFDLIHEMRAKLIEYTGDKNITDTFDNHILQYGIGLMHELIHKPGYFQDCFNVVWNRTVDKDIGIVDEYLLKDPSVDSISQVIPAVPHEHIYEVMVALNADKADRFAIIGIGFSLFERAWTLRGMDHLLMDMVLDPEFVDALLDAITDWNIACMEDTFAFDYDGFYFGDDWGMQKGLIMGPKLWRRFIKPRLKRMYAAAHKHGKYVLQHSCGDISEIYPDLVEIGLNAHQTFQPEIYDVEEIKKEYFGKLAFWGGISTQQMLPFATVDEVILETQRIIDIMGEGGGLIVAPTHAVPSDVPPENIIAMLKTFKEQDE